jgi:hypothetical protein
MGLEVFDKHKGDNQYINPDMIDCRGCRCPKCGSRSQHYEDLRGDFPHKCVECGFNWFVEGPDY